MAQDVQLGIYDQEYFSGSQASIYIDDVWVDEIVQINYNRQQTKRPLYGYADQLFRAVTKGQILVQGSFTINFKEAGYLWLILEHAATIKGGKPIIGVNPNEIGLQRQAINKIVSAEETVAERSQRISSLAQFVAQLNSNQPDTADSLFKDFEEVVWGSGSTSAETLLDRGTDNPRLNGFDIYLALGDFDGNNRKSHTVQKISNVHILGSNKVISSDGEPILETYSFIAQNQI